MSNLSNREKILLIGVFLGVAYFVNAFFISKEKYPPSVNAKNHEDLKKIMGNVSSDIEALSLSNFDNYVITRAQAEWARDPFPNKQFFSRPLVTSDELEERRKSAALKREEMIKRQKAEREKKVADEKRDKEAFLQEIKTKVENLRYTGYLKIDKIQMAIIGGREYMIGDEVDGLIIKIITPEVVTLQVKGNKNLVLAKIIENIPIAR